MIEIRRAPTCLRFAFMNVSAQSHESVGMLPIGWNPGLSTQIGSMPCAAMDTNRKALRSRSSGNRQAAFRKNQIIHQEHPKDNPTEQSAFISQP